MSDKLKILLAIVLLLIGFILLGPNMSASLSLGGMRLELNGNGLSVETASSKVKVEGDKQTAHAASSEETKPTSTPSPMPIPTNTPTPEKKTEQVTKQPAVKSQVPYRPRRVYRRPKIQDEECECELP